MTLVTPTVPSPGEEANSTDISVPINQLAAVVNGGLDDTNISGVSGSKIAAGTITVSQLGTDAVETAKIKDNNVTAAKLATNAITLGYTQITSNFTTTSTSFVDVTGMTSTVTVPSGGRRVKITVSCYGLQMNGAGFWALALVEDGTVIMQWVRNQDTASFNVPFTGVFSKIPTAGSHTYKLQAAVSANTLTFSAGTTSSTPATPGPASILVEAV